MKQTLIVAYFGDKTLGWSHVNGKPIFHGDKEWEKHARQAALAKNYISLYEGNLEGVAQIDNPENLKGVFLALAAFPRERIRISTCPNGMMENLGLSIEEFSPEDAEAAPEIDFSRNGFLKQLLASI